MLTSTNSACRIEPKVVNSSTKIESDGNRHHDGQTRGGALLIFELPTPGEPITWWQRQFCRDLCSEPLQQSPPYRGRGHWLERRSFGSVLTVDLDRTVDPANARNLRECDMLGLRQASAAGLPAASALRGSSRCRGPGSSSAPSSSTVPIVGLRSRCERVGDRVHCQTETPRLHSVDRDR